MKFSGRLQVEADPRNWLKTDLNLNQGRVELVSGDELLGSWSTAQVKAERVEGDRFELQLGDDRAVFAADDALAFSYEALPVLAKKTVLAAATTGLRGKLRKGLAGSERTTQPESQRSPRVDSPVAVPDLGRNTNGEATDSADVPLDLTDAPPPRKLRDLIQAAVRNNATEPADLDGTWWPGDDTSEFEGTPVTDDIEDPDDEPENDYSAPPIAAGVSSYLDAEALSDLPEIGQDEVQPQRPPFDLSPIFAEPDSDLESRSRPSMGLLDLEGTGFDQGETLGERPAEPFGWVRAAEEGRALVTDIEPRVVRSLETLIEEVRNGAMSPAQIGAVTDLIKAVAEAIDGRSRS